MRMVRLVYVSRFSPGVGANDVQRILRVSRKQNPERGITGALCYDPAFFLQCLEGPRDSVNDLYKHILRDDRHRDVTLLEYSEVDSRLFEGWSMAYVNLGDMTEEVLMRYSPGASFNPYEMNARQALEFILEVSRERKLYLEKQRAELGEAGPA